VIDLNGAQSPSVMRDKIACQSGSRSASASVFVGLLAHPERVQQLEGLRRIAAHYDKRAQNNAK